MGKGWVSGWGLGIEVRVVLGLGWSSIILSVFWKYALLVEHDSSSGPSGVGVRGTLGRYYVVIVLSVFQKCPHLVQHVAPIYVGSLRSVTLYEPFKDAFQHMKVRRLQNPMCFTHTLDIGPHEPYVPP